MKDLQLKQSSESVSLEGISQLEKDLKVEVHYYLFAKSNRQHVETNIYYFLTGQKNHVLAFSKVMASWPFLNISCEVSLLQCKLFWHQDFQSCHSIS